MRNNGHELLPIVVQENNALIQAKLLHQRLKVGTKLGTWFNRRIDEYGFELNKDYFQNLGSKTGRGGHNATDYLLTLDMAKEETRNWLIRAVSASMRWLSSYPENYKGDDQNILMLSMLLQELSDEKNKAS